VSPFCLHLRYFLRIVSISHLNFLPKNEDFEKFFGKIVLYILLLAGLNVSRDDLLTTMVRAEIFFRDKW